jgi:hypothetical protein
VKTLRYSRHPQQGHAVCCHACLYMHACTRAHTHTRTRAQARYPEPLSPPCPTNTLRCHLHRAQPVCPPAPCPIKNPFWFDLVVLILLQGAPHNQTIISHAACTPWLPRFKRTHICMDASHKLR